MLLLPIANATLEEFAWWFLQRLAEDRDALRAHAIDAIRCGCCPARAQAPAAA